MAAPRSKRRPLTVEDLWSLERLGSPTLSPDGATACATVTTFGMERNEGETSLWLFPTDPRGKGANRARRLTQGEKDAEPRWSPDGRHVAFVSKRKDDDVAQLYVIAPDGGEARRLTSLAGGASALRWFPDGKRIAFVSWVWPDLTTEAAQAKRAKARKESKVKAHLTERAEFRYWDHWLADGREPHLFACDVATGRSRDLLAGTGLRLRPWEPSADEYDIAPDGREIALTFDPHDEPKMMNRQDIVVLDLRTRKVRNLTASSGFSDEHPRYSPDGRWIAHHAYDTQRAFNDQGHLRLIDRASGRSRRLAKSFDRPTTNVEWTADSKALLCLVEDRGRVHLQQLALDAEAPSTLAPGGTVGGFARSADGRVIAFDRASSQHPAQIFAVGGDGSGERRLESRNDAVLRSRALGETQELTIKGWGGEPVHVFVTYPPGYDPKKKWPLMHSIHGGPHAAHQDGWHYRWNTHVFAGWGNVVVAVNYHGSSGYGQAFLETITGRYGEKEFADVEAATDHLLKQGSIDRDRLLATGGSYGGFMVAYMNGHTDRYRAYVCHAGCYDWVSMMATDGYAFFAKELGAFHWDDEALVLAQSPHHFVKHAKTPTLVIHGELDYRVPATQALQYYDTLKAKGVAARLVYFPDENHWILKPQNSVLWYREFEAWLARCGNPAHAAVAKRSAKAVGAPRAKERTADPVPAGSTCKAARR